MQSPTPSPTLIFDGHCGYCAWAIDMLTSLDRTKRLTFMPWQVPGTLERTGLMEHQVREAAWLLDDQPYRGAEAMLKALALAIGHPWPERFYRLPVVRWLADLTYRWVAAHRSWFKGTTPYCRRSGATCLPQGTS